MMLDFINSVFRCMFHLHEIVSLTVLFSCINTTLCIYWIIYTGPQYQGLCIYWSRNKNPDVPELHSLYLPPPCWAGGISVTVKLKRGAAPVGQMRDVFMRAAKVQMGEGVRVGKGDMKKEAGSVSMSWPQFVLPTLAS